MNARGRKEFVGGVSCGGGSDGGGGGGSSKEEKAYYTNIMNYALSRLDD